MATGKVLPVDRNIAFVMKFPSHCHPLAFHSAGFLHDMAELQPSDIDLDVYGDMMAASAFGGTALGFVLLGEARDSVLLIDESTDDIDW